jgi:hypothetical protein
MNISQLVWSNPDGIARDIELLKNVPIGPDRIVFKILDDGGVFLVDLGSHDEVY